MCPSIYYILSTKILILQAKWGLVYKVGPFLGPTRLGFKAEVRTGFRLGLGVKVKVRVEVKARQLAGMVGG